MFNQEVFLECVRRHGCLYDKSCTDFKDILLKKTIWTSIGIQFGITAEDSEKKWRNLRDRYRKEKKKVKDSLGSGTGAEEVYRPKWALFELMDGILGGLKEDESSISNYSQASCSNQEASSLVPDYDEILDSPGSNDRDLLIPSESPSTSSHSLDSSKAKKRKRDEMLDECLQTFKKTSEEMLTSNRDKDRIDHFTDSLNQRLRDLPTKRKQFETMRKLDNLMYECEDELLE